MMRFDDGLLSNTAKKVTLHNIHILDASGSMFGPKYDAAIEGINSEIQKIKEEPENLNYTLTVVEFKSGHINDIYLMQGLHKCSAIKGSGATGGTPLYETIHKTVQKILLKKKDEDVVILTIFTDRLFSKDTVPMLLNKAA